MSLTPSQTENARYLYDLAIHRGLAPQRAREFVTAAYKESSLDPNAKGPPVQQYGGRRAAGYFQLLSDGYVDRAERIAGNENGEFNPRANALSILPDYAGYWRSHPNAAPGDAARDVEKSGEGSGFYSDDLPLFSFLNGQARGSLPRGDSPTGPAVGTTAQGPSPRREFVMSIARSVGRGDPIGNVQDALSAFRTAQAQQPPPAPAATSYTPATSSDGPIPGSGRAGIREAFYDPLGGYDEGTFIPAIGGHSTHTHLSFGDPRTALLAIRLAQKLGLSVRENPYVDPVDPGEHVKDSYHKRVFPGLYNGRQLGEAGDFSGSPEDMAALYRWATRR